MYSHSKGFSLIEVLITISLIAILAGIGTTTFPSLLEKHRLSLVGKDLISQLNLARTKSILENRSYQLNITNHLLETRVNSVLIQSYSLPNEFSYPINGSIYFHGKGIASPKSIAVLSQNYSYKIIININGRIRTETSY